MSENTTIEPEGSKIDKPTQNSLFYKEKNDDICVNDQYITQYKCAIDRSENIRNRSTTNQVFFFSILTLIATGIYYGLTNNNSSLELFLAFIGIVTSFVWMFAETSNAFQIRANKNVINQIEIYLPLNIENEFNKIFKDHSLKESLLHRITNCAFHKITGSKSSITEGYRLISFSLFCSFFLYFLSRLIYIIFGITISIIIFIILSLVLIILRLKN